VTISNDGTVNNFGTIYNLCLSVFLAPPSNLGNGVTYNLDYCGLLPLVSRD
jgi:hypothetical protein